MTDWKGVMFVKIAGGSHRGRTKQKSDYYFSRLPNRRNRCCQLRVHYLRGNDLEACRGVHIYDFTNSHFPLKDSLDQKVEENYTPRI